MGDPVIVLGAIIEVGESYFWLWYSRRRKAQVGAETLIGEVAEVVTRCAPLGQVRLQGETWRARCEETAERGEAVRVVALEELTLVVERAPSAWEGLAKIVAVPPGRAASPRGLRPQSRPYLIRYERSLRPCLGTTIAPRRRAPSRPNPPRAGLPVPFVRGCAAP